MAVACISGRYSGKVAHIPPHFAMFSVCLALLLAQSLVAADNTYNYFDFVRQWSPNSCYKSGHPCKTLPAEINYWTIHGLWPSKDASHYPADCAGSSCQLNTTAIADLLDEMHLKWPTDYSGGDTKFWTHEYCKHGTCCTDVLPGIHDYFSAALKLNRQLDVDMALQSAGILPSVDKPYTFDQLNSAMKESFGVDEATYWCRYVKASNGESQQLVFQISVCITKDPSSLKPRDCPVAAGNSCNMGQPFFLLPFSVLTV